MRYSLMSGAGNLFVVVDGFKETMPADPAALARAMCGAGEQRETRGVQPRPDGLVLVKPPERGADCAMEIYNADGSRPETCGNGLRCAAMLAADRKHVPGDAFTIATDAGVREVRVERERGRVVAATAQMGRARILASDVEIRVPSGAFRVTSVDVGNPHCVLLVDDEREAPVAQWGPEIERHSSFAEGTNVEFLSHRSGALHLRVWERGVGETRACGSGACAAALVGVERGLAEWPASVELPGGTLVVGRDERGVLALSGPVEELRSDEWIPPPAGRSR